MVKIMIAPNRYIQGPGVIRDIAKYISHLGSRFLFIGGPTAISLIKERALASLQEKSLECHFEEFSGECTRASASDLSKKARQFGAGVIVGVGGGRAIDTAKAVSVDLDS